MIRALLCRLNIGHHWLAETDSEGWPGRRCSNCGRYDRHHAKWPKYLSAADRPGKTWGPLPW
jgi:hypothetical protein